jgi:hypothetical protein
MQFKRRSRVRDRHQRATRDRRRAERLPAGWESRYVVLDPDDQLWLFATSDKEPCVVRNLSPDGAGLEFACAEVATGQRVALNLQLGDGRAGSIQLIGEVRHATTDDEGIVTAGIEFVDVGDLERALLVRLIRDIKTRGRATG